MATEEQATYDQSWVLRKTSGYLRAGQDLTITNRTVTKMSFPLKRWTQSDGSTNVATYYEIRLQSDLSLVYQQEAVAWATLTDDWVWYEITLTTPQSLSGNYWIGIYHDSGTVNAGVSIGKNSTDIKASEGSAGQYNVAPYNWWTEYTNDTAYIYTYDTNVAPTVTTQAVTTILQTTATGNGNITSLGIPASVTQHGHCWNTTGTPTTADSKTTNGTGAVGAFTSAMTGLIAGTFYYVKAYATNATGTGYGTQVTFTTLSAFIPKIFYF